MTTITTSLSNVEDLTLVLDELTTQADAVLASVLVLQNVRKKHTNTTDPSERTEYATALREHGIALETDLGIIKLNAEFVTGERLEKWVDDAISAADRADRKFRLERLIERMRSLEEEVSRFKNRCGGG
jgi:hypothetical protein